VAEKIAEKSQGKGRGGMRGWANDVLSPRVDPKAKLLRAVRKAVEFASGAGDYSYRRPNRRNPRPDMVLPSSVQPIPRVTVIVDTSGSMDQRDLGLSLGLIGKVLNGFRIRDGLRVLCGDESVASVGKVFSPKQVELAGGGGTDMRPLIFEAAKAKPQPGVIVVCTDGYTPWPSDPVGVPVVACITRESTMKAVPPWMEAVCLQ
jgi:predicted metal-dependent peptidase